MGDNQARSGMHNPSAAAAKWATQVTQRTQATLLLQQPLSIPHLSGWREMLLDAVVKPKKVEAVNKITLSLQVFCMVVLESS